MNFYRNPGDNKSKQNKNSPRNRSKSKSKKNTLFNARYYDKSDYKNISLTKIEIHKELEKNNNNMEHIKANNSRKGETTNTTMNYIEKLQNNLKNCSTSLELNQSKIKFNNSFSPTNNINKYDYGHFITFKNETAKKVSNVFDNEIHSFSNVNANNNHFSKEILESSKRNSLITSDRGDIFLKNKNLTNYNYVHYTDVNENLKERDINNNNVLNHSLNFGIKNKFTSPIEFLNREFLEMRQEIINSQPNLSRSFSNNINNLGTSRSLNSLKSPRLRLDENLSTLYKNPLSEITKNKSYCIIHSIRNPNNNCFDNKNNTQNQNFNYKNGIINKTASYGNDIVSLGRGAAYEKCRSFSFLNYKAYRNDIKDGNINFKNFQINKNNLNKNIKQAQLNSNPIKSQNNSLEIKGFYETDRSSTEKIHDHLDENFKVDNAITCKMINDSEIIINWLRSLKVKEAEKLKFFDDAFRDNTKYMRKLKHDSIMREIKKGYIILLFYFTYKKFLKILICKKYQCYIE